MRPPCKENNVDCMLIIDLRLGYCVHLNCCSAGSPGVAISSGLRIGQSKNRSWLEQCKDQTMWIKSRCKGCNQAVDRVVLGRYFEKYACC